MIAASESYTTHHSVSPNRSILTRPPLHDFLTNWRFLYQKSRPLLTHSCYAAAPPPPPNRNPCKQFLRVPKTYARRIAKGRMSFRDPQPCSATRPAASNVCLSRFFHLLNLRNVGHQLGKLKLYVRPTARSTDSHSVRLAVGRVPTSGGV